MSQKTSNSQLQINKESRTLLSKREPAQEIEVESENSDNFPDPDSKEIGLGTIEQSLLEQ